MEVMVLAAAVVAVVATVLYPAIDLILEGAQKLLLLPLAFLDRQWLYDWLNTHRGARDLLGSGANLSVGSVTLEVGE